jgi:hypothetical protein
MVRPAGYAPASQHWQCRVVLVDYGRLKMTGAPSLGFPNAIDAPGKTCPADATGPQAFASCPQDFTIKNEHHYELLLLVPTGISRWMFRCFRHTSPATFYLYFDIEGNSKPLVM